MKETESEYMMMPLRSEAKGRLTRQKQKAENAVQAEEEIRPQ